MIMGDFRTLHKMMLTTLETAAKERPARQGQVPIPGDPEWTEFGWVAFERQALFAAVNKERVARGFPPVTLKDLMRVEQFAVGHTDYMRKYALYAAELAVDRKDIQP